MTPLEALQKAICTAGGPDEFAAALGVPRERVEHWLTRSKKLSVVHCTKAEKLFGVSCFDLRPDMYPAPQSSRAKSGGTSGLKEAGFADSSAAQATRRDLRDQLLVEREWGKRRRASIVRRQSELLVEIIDYRVKEAGFVQLPGFLRLLRHPVEGIKDLLARAWKAPFPDAHHGDLSERAILDHSLGLAERLFEIGDAFFVDHPDLPPLENDKPKTSAAAKSAHRLSESL